MKKILFATNLMLLGCIVYFNSCHRGDDKVVVSPSATCPTCKDYTDSGFNGLPVDAANQLATLYATNHYPNYTIGGSATDSKAIWFSLDSLKKFISKIEEAMCKCDPKPELGVRIYFGEYPDVNSMAGNASFNTLEPGMAQRHTLFMVPTYSDGTADFDFDPWHLGDGGCSKPTTICEWFGSADSTFLNSNMLALAPDESRSVRNHGNMCPPLCPAGASCFPNAAAFSRTAPSGTKSEKK